MRFPCLAVQSQNLWWDEWHCKNLCFSVIRFSKSLFPYDCGKSESYLAAVKRFAPVQSCMFKHTWISCILYLCNTSKNKLNWASVTLTNAIFAIMLSWYLSLSFDSLPFWKKNILTSLIKIVLKKRTKTNCNLSWFMFSLPIQCKHMAERKTVLELKDVPPPPPHHASSSQSLQPFPLPPLPLLPPCLPPAPHLTQNQHHHQQLPLPPQHQQEGASPKVSICFQCDYCRANGYGLPPGSGIVGSSSKVVGVGAPVNGGTVLSGPCSVPLSVCHNEHSVKGQGGQVLTPLNCHTYKPQNPSSIATSQPVSSHPYHSCCHGVLHSYLSAPLSVPSLFTSSAPLSPSLPFVASSVPASTSGSCLASSGYPACGVGCCLPARGCQRSTHCDHTSSTTTTTTSSARFYSNSMHLNLGHTVCVKGGHCCQDCMLKVGKDFYCEQKFSVLTRVS